MGSCADIIYWNAMTDACFYPCEGKSSSSGRALYAVWLLSEIFFVTYTWFGKAAYGKSVFAAIPIFVPFHLRGRRVWRGKSYPNTRFSAIFRKDKPYIKAALIFHKWLSGFIQPSSQRQKIFVLCRSRISAGTSFSVPRYEYARMRIWPYMREPVYLRIGR